MVACLLSLLLLLAPINIQQLKNIHLIHHQSGYAELKSTTPKPPVYNSCGSARQTYQRANLRKVQGKLREENAKFSSNFRNLTLTTVVTWLVTSQEPERSDSKRVNTGETPAKEQEGPQKD
ncbi:hypothetical protein B0H16DRAFT_1452870 [Mycena metata]|uniref:Uncharacterized protein n=1 Tax=Mycena metata TaxID=1033252 RepID=A0AAD7NPH8_9AGAR|nr:hypothetical protein B0H16DRAFT_1452870 [Mycena metata]